MSRALPANQRIENDAYYTPEALAAAGVKLISFEKEDIVLEPSCGGGAFIRAFPKQENGLFVVACDINPAAPGLKEEKTDAYCICDFLEFEPMTGWLTPDWVIGNPPFREAEEHVRHAISLANKGVMFLLRLGFLESQARLPFWREHPAAEVHVLAKRPSFTGGGTDSAAYAFFIWKKDHEGPTTLHHLEW